MSPVEWAAVLYFPAWPISKHWTGVCQYESNTGSNTDPPPPAVSRNSMWLHTFDCCQGETIQVTCFYAGICSVKQTLYITTDNESSPSGGRLHEIIEHHLKKPLGQLEVLLPSTGSSQHSSHTELPMIRSTLFWSIWFLLVWSDTRQLGRQPHKNTTIPLPSYYCTDSGITWHQQFLATVSQALLLSLLYNEDVAIVCL